MDRLVYSFGPGEANGCADMRDLLGSKGANLAQMSLLGLPVPPGLTVTTDVCTHFYAHDRKYPADLADQVLAALAKVEKEVGATFGDPKNPLLVSVRSGARASMPGMMDTVLNLGLNDSTVAGLAERTGDPRFAYDSYRRFIQMYGDVVLGVEHYQFMEVLEHVKRDGDLTLDTDLTADDWRTVVDRYKQVVQDTLEAPFPQDPKVQLWGAIGAVFGSWMNHRAITYRRLHDIPSEWGTAVNVQAMVFGNMGDDCATGVAFTRNPSTGEKAFYGEYLINSQGEDLWVGIRTPRPLTKAAERERALPSMERTMAGVYRQLDDIRKTLEAHYRDMQDIEFTVQQNRLYILQTRSGKCTVEAALKITVDMADEGLITMEEAIARIDPDSLDQLFHQMIDPDAEKRTIAIGLPASPGIASGQVVFSADDAVALAKAGRKVILVCVATDPKDIHGMHVSQGILASRGGMTGHASAVARRMGRPCIANAKIDIDYKKKCFISRGHTVREEDAITIDGGNGTVYLGNLPIRDEIRPWAIDSLLVLLKWVEQSTSRHSVQIKKKIAKLPLF